MMAYTYLALVLCFILILSLLNYFSRKNVNQLSGPRGIPFLGHIFHLTKQPWRKFLQWKMEYGPVFEITILGQRIAIVSSMDTLLETYSQHEALGSLDLEFFKKITAHRGGGGIAFVNGKDWEDHHKFVVKSFTDFGTRDERYAQSIQVEARRIVDQMKKQKGLPVSLESLFEQYTLNAAWRAMANSSFTPDDTNLVLTTGKAVTIFTSIWDYLGLLFPNFFDKFTSVIEWRFETSRRLYKILQTFIEEHLDMRVRDYPRDIVDKYQDVVDKTEDTESIFHASKKSIVTIMMDISNAAVDTSAGTLQWFLLFLLKYPDVKAKIQAEISQIISQDREPSYADQRNMPYTEACILETLRAYPVAPYGMPRRVQKNIQVAGKTIPKGVVMIPDLIGVNHDPLLWENPEQFIPERFLTSEGTIDSKIAKKICTFSIGRHHCPGERFARQTLFLIATSLIQNFDITTKESVSFETTTGFIRRPSKPIAVYFKLRM